MMNLTLKPTPLTRHMLQKTLNRLYATSVEPVRKETSSDDSYEKELKKYKTLTNIVKRTREKKPQREPFVKNLLRGIFDKEILTFPEIDLHEVKNVEGEVAKLSSLLKQRHMVNVDSLGNKNFRQNLSDYRAIGLEAPQLMDGRDSCPMEVMRFLDILCEHKLRDSLLHHEMLGVRTLIIFADDRLKQKYLYPIMKGENVCAFAVNENRLTDLYQMNTEAKLSNDLKYWTLNGTKTYVVNGISADFIVVFAISEKVLLHDEAKNSLTAFLVEKESAGVSCKQLPSNVELAEITFDNVQVPAENVIGKVHDAENVLKPIISNFRLSCGSACNALSRNMINNLYTHMVELSSKEFDWTETDAVRSRLGEVSMEVYVAESVTYLTAGLQDWYENQDVDVESAIAKVISSEAAHKISTACLDMVGLPATDENHWTRKSHNEILNYLTLYETNENLRMFIAVNGLQHAAQCLHERIKKLRNPLYHGTFNIMRMITEFRRGSNDPKLDLDLFGHLHPSCEIPSKQLELCVKELEYVVERFLTMYGIECLNKHCDLRRLADIIIDCYAMTAVLARASRSYCIGLQFADFEIVLALAYCNLAMQRVKDNTNNIRFTEFKANGRNHIAFGKRLILSKGYFIQNPISRFF